MLQFCRRNSDLHNFVHDEREYKIISLRMLYNRKNSLTKLFNDLKNYGVHCCYRNKRLSSLNL